MNEEKSKKMLAVMIEKQKAYDQAVLEKMGMSKPPKMENIVLALIDEMGELNHELKSDWCYWKKSQKQKDKIAIGEELADVWHFALSLICYTGCDKYVLKKIQFDGSLTNRKDLPISFYETRILDKAETIRRYFGMSVVCVYIRNSAYLMIAHLIDFSARLGYDFDKVYIEYWRKNEKNWDRVRGNY